jgi:hypothetical protein
MGSAGTEQRRKCDGEGNDGKAAYVTTTNPVKSQWNERFLDEMYNRVGDCAVQDVALSIKQMVALTELFEEDYKRVMRNKHRTPSQVREVLFPSALFSILVYRGLD